MASTKGVLVDITRCIGCESCVVACRLYNGLEPGQKNRGKTKQNGNTELAPDKWTAVQGYRVDKDGNKVRRFVKKQCLHCLEPACASACFARALQKTPEGPVVYNEKLCVGCRYCMIACPFGILRFEWDKPFPRVLKCQMCLARVADNQMPACASVCPTGAVTFGERDKIVEEAKKRQASNPNLYVSQIYGLKEAGGTSWLYLSDVAFDKLGFRTDVPEKPIPEYTWQVLRWTPHIFIGWGALLTGMYLYTKRRAAVHAEEEMYAPVDVDEK
ncbi:MAG: 4Fe-4S dicluster domain-containing protein [Pelotomaculum sp.]|uniref:Fe-S-cluster-containing hydrogenase components 1 n=1 Tax=Pelotomaculum thermopropionicum (strain DSM 13744 / JCM 10971 / SI) TaxID=370438 RepID=A5D4J0_PELTS|nr:4Fe-4S dicluster domain-containing protein [Pelotomaculum sp.]BAF58850.1 Fe-S-cluster-containing hydrogenase components 1 [Pelotomaculum thermopropionicum SI]